MEPGYYKFCVEFKVNNNIDDINKKISYLNYDI
jgi:hypothetical protein